MVSARVLHYDALRRRLLGASAYLVGAQVARVLLNYGTIAFLARALSLRELGIYFMLNEVGRIGALVSQAGFTQSTQKFLGRMTYEQAGDLPTVQRRMCLLVLATTGTVVLVCFAFWSLAASQIVAFSKLDDFALFGGIMIVVRALNAYASSVLRSIDKMGKSILSFDLMQKAGFLIGVLLIAVAPAMHMTLYLVLVAWAVMGVMSVSISMAFVAVEMHRLRQAHAPDRRALLPGYRELLLTSLPMGVGTGLATLRNSADVLIAGAILGPVAAGVYGPCRMLANLITFVLQAVRSALPATIAAAWSALPKAQVEALIRKAANYGAIAALPPAILLIVAGNWVLQLGFGDKLAGHGVLLAVLTCGPLISAFFGMPGPVLQVLNRHVAQMCIVAGVTLISLVAMILVVYAFGLVGIAALSSVMVILQDVALCYAVYRLLQLRTYFRCGTF